jgi:hypothetical protein
MTKVVDIRGERIGKIDGLFIHGDGDEPNWALVRRGWLGFRSSFVPLQDAVDDDGQVRIPYERGHVKLAPKVEPEGSRLSDDEAELLHRHFGLERVVGMTSKEADDDIELSRETRDAEPPGMKEGPDSPLTKRRRRRARELGVPQHQ